MVLRGPKNQTELLIATQEVIMSAIIKFPLEKVQRTSSSNAETGKTAEILMFEGVQYSKPLEREAVEKGYCRTKPATEKRT